MGIYLNSVSTFSSLIQSTRVWIFNRFYFLSLFVFACAGIFFFQSPCAFANIDGNEWLFHAPDKTHRFPVKFYVRGSPLVSIPEISDRLGLKRSFNPSLFRVELINPKNRAFAFIYTYTNLVETSVGNVWLSRPPEFIDVTPYIGIDVADLVLTPLLTKQKPFIPQQKNLEPVDVIIDPGHGGNDHGALFQAKSIVFREKDLVLQIAHELMSALRQHRIKVTLTRQNDYFLPLSSRVSIANQRQAKLMLSLHLNFHSDSKIRGHQMFVLDLKSTPDNSFQTIYREHQTIPKDLGSGPELALAELQAQTHFAASLEWAKQLSQSLGQSSWARSEKSNPSSSFVPPSGRGVLSGPFYVLYGAQMPGVLVELGFLSQESDRAVLTNPLARAALIERMAETIANRLQKQKTHFSAPDPKTKN